MAKITAVITVENDKGEIKKYRAFYQDLNKVNFSNTKPEFLLDAPELQIGEYFDSRGRVIKIINENNKGMP